MPAATIENPKHVPEKAQSSTPEKEALADEIVIPEPRPGVGERVRGYFTPLPALTEEETRVLAVVELAQLRWERRIDQVIKARRGPYAVSAVTAAVGEAAWWVGQTAAHPLAVAPVAAALMLATAAVVRVKRRKVLSAGWRRRVWQVGTVSALWVTLNALQPHPGLVLVMLGGLFVLQHVLSRRLRADHPMPVGAVLDQVTAAVTELEEADPIGSDVVERFAALWETHIAAERGALPGSSLSGGTATEYAVRYTLHLVPGQQDIGTVRGKLPKIASGLGPDPGDLIPEPHPRAEDEEKNSARIQLTIVLRSPVARPRFFEGPRLNMSESSCSAVIGRFADGVGEATWSFWNSGGMRNGVLIGSTRSGKSGLSVALAVSGRATGRLNSIYVDPQGGMSSPGLGRHATIGVYGREGAHRAIDVVEALARSREERGGVNKKGKSRKEMFANAKSKYMPTPEQPGWVVYIDECDKIFRDPKQAALWSEFVSRCLKLGMCVIAITQYVGLTSFGLESLRSNLALNYVALRTGSKSSKGLLPGMTQDPAELPDGMPGYGLFGGGQRSDVPFRGDWLPEADDAAKLDEVPPWTLEAAMEAHDEPAVCAEDRAALVALIGEPDEEGLWTVLGDESFVDGGDADSPTRVAAGSGGSVSLGGLDLPPVPEPVTLTPLVLENSDQAVLAVVRSGVFKTKDIIARTGLSRAQVHRCLPKLGGHGLVHNPRQGVWEPAADEEREEEQAV